MNYRSPLKKLKPLTKRQIEVLAAIAFGEVFYKEVYVKHSLYGKWLFDGVDVSSVLRILRARKLIRRRPGYDRQCDDVHSFTYHYVVPTAAGFEELEKHPEQWND